MPAPVPVTLGEWVGQSVTIDDVLDALSGLRHQAERTAVRTAVVNLVVAAGDQESAERTASALRRLGGHHPRRTTVIRTEPGPARSLDASVTLFEAGNESRRVWWEEVGLTVHGAMTEHLDSLMAPLTLPDLLTVVWFPTIPAPHDPLVRLADTVLVDARFAGAVDGGQRWSAGPLLELASAVPVIDLSWKRLSPWRRMLAHLFDDAASRPFLTGISRAEVFARPGPRHLLAGWLCDRLGLPATSVIQHDAIHASIRLAASVGGRSGRFSVDRPSDEGVVYGRTELDDLPAWVESEVLPEHGLTRSLAEAVGDLTHDPVYEAALRCAAQLTG
ncbi:MAG: glucose-6-phosphate dehydrogenase assembly protein OpcA [Acidimicrobiales bacterium]|nr:glucose-6-phosphate dehydrogenase assembly protein OpcA [Acidimicrobiales bacterium]